MKRLIVLLLILCLILAGCGQTAPKVAAPESSVPESSSAFAEEMTVEKVRELFLQTADASCTVQDCVLADDGAYDLVGVVQYGKEADYTHFAFVQADGLWQTVGIAAVPSGESGLEYLGNATVGVTLFAPEKGASSYTTIEYSNDGEGHVHFVASAEAKDEMTVEKVRELFLQTADASCTVQDCVLIDDGAYDLVGVVQYSQGDEFTHFAFVEADGHWQTAAIMATVVENGELKYIGDGEITTKLLNEETNEILKFTLQYSNRNNGEIYFVSSSKPIF